MTALPRVDWFRVLADLQRVGGMTRADVAFTLELKERTLRGYYSDGNEPNHRDGELILALWCSLLERPREAIPREWTKHGSLSAARAKA